MMSTKSCIVLVSGGLDSAVTLAVARQRGYGAYGLTISYGQKHRLEIQAAQRVCASIGVREHKLIDLDLPSIGGSALVDGSAVPKGPRSGGSELIPVTYVPARNTIFLSLALAWAEVIQARDIFIGVSSVDYSGYPDCRPRFIEAFEVMANLGTRAVDHDFNYTIQAPLLHLSKAETIRLGDELGVDFSLTWTCYDPGDDDRPCGQCEACRFREKGFLEAGKVDPLFDNNG